MTLELADFEGAWRLSRHIMNAGGPDARLDGQARFHAEGGGALLYQETGTLTLEGQGAIHAERRYLWRSDGPGRVAVFFDDGRPFHAIALDKAQPQDRHWCDPDTYDVAYDFTQWPFWSVEWQVSGPRKSYRMQSRYWRV